MKTSATYFLFCYFLVFLMPDFFAQQNTITTGGEISGSQGFVSFSIGQIDYVTNASDVGTISEGVQQPYEISVMDEPGVNPEISVYQNLTSDFVVLSIQLSNLENMHYTLSDVQGKAIRKQNIVENTTTISFTEFANAIYFISVYSNDDKKLKTFKIVKN